MELNNTSTDMKRPYLKVFFSAFFIFLISLLPILILTKGVYVSWSDYEVQTLPFLDHVNRLYHSEAGLPVFDWGTGLGMDFLSAFSGFILTPFAAILCVIPTAWLPYAHGVVNALKMGVAAVTACGYCRQYVKTNRSAFMCGMLYAFSGFQLFNLVYQFMDTICLFPLLLFTFDKLVLEHKPIAFALMLALHGFISYFFLWEECLFLLIYFVVRTAVKSFPKLTVKKFIQLAIETLFGVGLCSVILVTTIYALQGNVRGGKLIFSANLLAFEDAGVILRMIQSLFLPPEFCGIGWYFTDHQLCVSPPALYIPLFTITGVSVIFRKNRKSWHNVLLIVCLIIACIPVTNSIFAMFNLNYYSRWFFMPLLVMIMMTGMYLDNPEQYDITQELKVSAIVTGFLAVFGIYSVYSQEKMMSNIKTTWLWFMLTALCQLGIMYLLYHPQENLKFFSMKNLSVLTCICCLLPFFERNLTIAQMGYSDYAANEIRRIWNDFEPVEINDDQYFRISSADSPNDNIGIGWGYPTVTLFNSLISGEESQFYARVGIDRPHSNTFVNTKDYALQTFLSVKYDFYLNLPLTGGIVNEPEIVVKSELFKKEGYTDYTEHGNYILFENSAFVPMGFTYDYYLDIDDFVPLYEPQTDDDKNSKQRMIKAAFEGIADEEEMKTRDKEKLLLKAIWLTKDQIEKYQDILEPLPEDLKEDVSVETYYQDCADRAASACYEFNTDNEGFTARINLEKDNLVFFSVPYTKSFTAFVDGVETEIERVFDGLMAVPVPEGDHEIVFHYEIAGLKTGLAMSAGSAVVLLIYGVVFFIMKKKENLRKD